MHIADLPRRIRLAPGDYFMYGQDRRMRRVGLRGNVCRVALRLDGALNTQLLRQRVAASPMLDWLARVRITRPLPAFPPVWRTVAQPGAVLHEHTEQEGGEDGPGRVPPVVMERDLHAGEGPALALDLVRCADETRQRVLAQWRGSDWSAEEKLRRPSAKAAGDIMPKVLTGLRLERRQAETEILKVWRHQLDPNIAAHAQPTGLRNGTLFVAVDSSA